MELAGSGEEVAEDDEDDEDGDEDDEDDDDVDDGDIDDDELKHFKFQLYLSSCRLGSARGQSALPGRRQVLGRTYCREFSRTLLLWS